MKNSQAKLDDNSKNQKESNYNFNYKYNSPSLSFNSKIKIGSLSNEPQNYTEKDIFSPTIFKESEVESKLKKISKALDDEKSNSYSIITDEERNEKIESIENNLLELKKLGYPEMGKFFLSPDPFEQEKSSKFFEFLLNNENEKINNKEKNKKKYEKLDMKLYELKTELNNEIKSNALIKKELEQQITSQKKYYEKYINELNNENFCLKNSVSEITKKKNSLELKLDNMKEKLDKFEKMKSVIVNAFEAIDYVQSKDMSKMLSRIKNTEKLIEVLKDGYNDTIKELKEENNFFKNFIIEMNYEISSLLSNSCNINNSIYNMPFLDAFKIIKDVFRNNMNLLKEKIGHDISNTESIENSFQISRENNY